MLAELLWWNQLEVLPEVERRFFVQADMFLLWHGGGLERGRRGGMTLEVPFMSRCDFSPGRPPTADFGYRVIPSRPRPLQERARRQNEHARGTPMF
jgi:hypothetical protein